MCVLLFGAAASIWMSFYCGPSAKWLESAGLLFDISGIIQLDIAGAFERIVDKYGKAKEYPYGPPSNITRLLSEDAEHPWRTAIRDFLFFNTRIGFILIVVGFFFQFAANWAQ
jgi:hypothetical protein